MAESFSFTKSGSALHHFPKKTLLCITFAEQQQQQNFPSSETEGTQSMQNDSEERKSKLKRIVNHYKWKTEIPLYKTCAIVTPPELFPATKKPHSPGKFHAKIVEVEVDGVAIYRPFGEFHRANSYCHLYGTQGLGQRQAFF
ncbi:hypothetical protein TNCV_3507581 [Trichonephila clavipes]|uniref:Uncharacterized protein n=1 Tax=Trichonephila clavipes TaxID=2585209 RepID=A0A8X6S147_TRICX|nr:hypothetical protein TNCV_3507581 [Trichonephila clavipes]